MKDFLFLHILQCKGMCFHQMSQAFYFNIRVLRSAKVIIGEDRRLSEEVKMD